MRDCEHLHCMTETLQTEHAALDNRPWGPRAVYSDVRSLGAAMLKKFDSDGYVRDVGRLAAAERE